MKIEYKKIIAREFLILVVVAMLTGFTYVYGYINNYFLNFKINNVNKEISIIENKFHERLIVNRLYHQDWICNMLIYEFSSYLSNFNTTNLLWPQLHSLVSNGKWDTKEWDKSVIDFLVKNKWNPDSFKSFLVTNSLTFEEQQCIKVTELTINSLNKVKAKHNYMVWGIEKRNRIASMTALILFSVCFGCRYFFYSVRWSLKQIKS